MKRSGGYSIMEVFLAIVLVSTIFFALATIVPTSLAGVRKGQSTIVAQNLAAQVMEAYRNLPFKATPNAATAWTPAETLTDLAVNATPQTFTWPNPAATLPLPAPPGWDGTVYAVLVTVSNIAPVDANVLQLDVEVDWDAGSMGGNGVNTTGNYANTSVHDSTCVYCTVNPW